MRFILPTLLSILTLALPLTAAPVTQPTRNPGTIVFENVLAYITQFASSQCFTGGISAPR